MHKTMIKMVAVAAITALCTVSLVLTGCGSSSANSSSAASASASASSASEGAQIQADATFGDKADDASVLLVKNSTGKEITAISLVALPTAEGAQPSTLLAVDGSWADGKTAAFYYKPADSTVLTITLASGEELFTLHSFDVKDAEDIEIFIENGIAYVVCNRDGGEVSTLAQETEIRNAEIAAAEAAAAAAEAEAAAAEEEWVEEEYYYYEPEPTYNAPAQSQDQCVDGGVVLR